MHAAPIAPGSVARVRSLAARSTGEPWPFAATHAAAIADHWRRRLAENPSFYDGQVFVLRRIAEVDVGSCIEAHFTLQRFSQFLFWRDHPEFDDGTLDGFGSALIRSVEGHALLARHAAGTLNAGLLYLPGGFLDARDAGPDGTIDVDAAIARELAEETGLDTSHLARSPGYIVARTARHCCFAIEYRSPLPATALRARMLAGLAGDEQHELTDIAIVRDAADLARLDVRSHARLLLEAVFAGRV